MRLLQWAGLSVAIGCGTPSKVETGGDGFSPFTAPAGGDADADSDADSDSDGTASECDDYRTEYPSGPYGNSEGDIMADLPGMVDPTGAAMSLVDIFQDRTKQVLVIANAFDT